MTPFPTLSRLAPLTLALLCVGCPETDDGFTSGLGDDDTTEEPPEVPDEVLDFMSIEDFSRFEDAGMPLYFGDDPPDVEGTYLLDSLVVDYDDDGWEGMPILTYWMTFYEQTAAQQVSCDYVCPEGDDEGSGGDGYIAGDDDCFTVFINVTGNAYGCDYASPSVYSGCTRPEGIFGFHHGFIMKEKSGENCEILVPEEHIRVVEETDNMASTTDPLEEDPE